MSHIYREITPLTPYDCFTLFKREKTFFDFPVHVHEEFELNLILNGRGVKRFVGDHHEVIKDAELVLVGTNLPHGWITADDFVPHNQVPVEEITIQFHKDFFDDNFLRRNQLYFIRELLDKSSKGIWFCEETTLALVPRIRSLTEKSGFESVLELMGILHELSLARNFRLLSGDSFTDKKISYNSRRIEAVFNYMRTNFNQEVTLSEVSKIAGMTDVSFSRFIKKRTGKTFIDSLNEIRLGHATRMLIDTSETISEIAYKCGFNNLSYFNRLFKSRKNMTPKQFREQYSGTRTFI